MPQQDLFAPAGTHTQPVTALFNQSYSERLSVLLESLQTTMFAQSTAPGCELKRNVKANDFADSRSLLLQYSSTH